MTCNLGIGTNSEFIDEEFSSLGLNDIRLDKRTKHIALTLQNKLGSCVRRLFTEKKDARQCYDFFSNPKVSSERLLSPHYENTVKRIKASKSDYILAIQDQMYLNFTKHKAKIDLGRIGKSGKTTQYGIIQHSTLCVDDKNEPFGLIDVAHFDYSDVDVSEDRGKRAIEDKASIAWISSLKNMRQRLGDSKKRIITVGDRESDFYAFLHPLIHGNEEFVIRSQHNRILGKEYKKGNQKLQASFENAPIVGKMRTTIQDPNSREIKNMTLFLKAATIDIPVPNKLKQEVIDKNKYTPIRLNVVVAYNENHKWTLLTTLPIKTILQIRKIVKIYRSRWHIEDYHKVLKTGYQVDEIYLHSSKEAIKNLLVLASISACRLYWLIYIGRTQACVKADQLFEEFEWKSLYVYFKEPVPEESPSIAEIVLKIARLGGYKSSKHSGPPGIKSMWIGYQQFTIAAQMYRNMSLAKI